MPTYKMGGQSGADVTASTILEFQKAASEQRAKMLQWGAILLTFLSQSNQQTVEQQRSGPIYDQLKDARDALKGLSLTASSDADKVRNACVDAFDETLRGFSAGSTASQGLLSGGGSNQNNLLLVVFLLFAMGGGGLG